MKKLVVLFLFSVSSLHGQSDFEQTLYGNKIDLVVDQPAGYVDFFDAQGTLLGRKKIKKEGVFYYDKKLRLLSTIKAKAHQKVDSTNVNKKKTKVINQVLLDTDSYVHGNLIVQHRKNQIFYYTLSGQLLRSSKKNRFSNRVVYRDAQGKRLGSKKRRRSGEIIYKDSAKRLTGKSSVNANGVLVYKAYKNRVTPQFMLVDPH